VEYRTRPADDPREAHVNYACPCGCTAGLMYSREAGSLHVGECCCGRLLWLGAGAETAIATHYKPLTAYDLDIDTVTLPWGESVQAALAVPTKSTAESPATEEHGHPEGHGHEHPHAHEEPHAHGPLGHDHGEQRAQSLRRSPTINPRCTAPTTPRGVTRLHPAPASRPGRRRGGRATLSAA
jgi:hypothetical protein